tara:strand:+ start:1358 stop:2026 length:669 start_codon:yes stop_codon:yes gene_type:complete
MNNLFQRIITSGVLLIILSISLFYNKYIWLFVLILASLVLFIEFNNLIMKIWKKDKSTISIIRIFSLFFLFILVFVAYNVHSNPPVGLLFIISICIFSDTGGYIVGNLIGGKKLTKISPNKTISGSIGSFIFSLLPVIIFIYFHNFNKNWNLENYNYLSLIFVCLFLSLICQLGDLFISYFKRKAKVDDTGSILPGHGGLLDRIDGIIFVIPAAYIIDKIFF